VLSTHKIFPWVLEPRGTHVVSTYDSESAYLHQRKRVCILSPDPVPIQIGNSMSSRI